MQWTCMLNLPSRYFTLDLIGIYYIIVQVSCKLVNFLVTHWVHFKPMHKGLICFNFHCIIMFGTQDPSETPEFVFWFLLLCLLTFQYPLLCLGVLCFVMFII